MEDPTLHTEHFGRRHLLSAIAGSATLLSSGAETFAGEGIKAVVFDAFPIFNPKSVFATAEALLPNRGQALAKTWFQKIFSDTLLRTAAGQYIPFNDVAAECLDYVSRTSGLRLDIDARDRLLATFSTLEVWPDVMEQLRQLRAQGLRLAFLSNMTEAMLRDNIRRNGLDFFVEAVLSTDLVRKFKPAPDAYALALRALGLQKQQIGFAAFAAWDAAGASWFGYPTAWVNRQAQQPEPGAPTVRTGLDLSIVVDLVTSSG